MSNPKVAFFFGAGAEGTGNYGISTGLEYMKASLFGYGLEGYTSKLSEYFCNEYYKDLSKSESKYKYQKKTLTPSHKMIKNIFIEKIRHSPSEMRGLECDMALFLNKDDTEDIKNEYDETDDSYKLADDIDVILKGGINTLNDYNEKRNNIIKEFEKIMHNNITYENVEQDVLKKLYPKEEKGAIFDADMQLGMGGYLDSYFHTIINPYKYGPVRFSKVFNYYWACYFIILKKVLALFPNIQSMVCDEKDSSKIDWGKVLNQLPELSRKLYEEQIPVKESYYKAIDKICRESDDDRIVGVLTTNYFCFAEKVLKMDEERVAYLNGQLKWMEKPEKLEVIDITANKSIDGLFFPFIFGPSMTKPIVHHYQIREFQKAKSILDKAEYLVVIGYGINEDDNHINSLLHCFATENKKIVVLNRNNETVIKDSVVITETATKLRCEKNSILCCNVSEEQGSNEKCVKKILDSIFEDQESISNAI